jgi:anthranilate/para-aminobenzoate synthase component II
MKKRLGQDENDKGRTMQQVSHDLQNANLDEKETIVGAPGPKTPEEMQMKPQDFVPTDDVTGD